MLQEIVVGLISLFGGIMMGVSGHRPWIDWNFIFAWFGFLLILNQVIFHYQKKPLFPSYKKFFFLSIASALFWWFYEWMNMYLKNWDYPQAKYYNGLEWGIIATLAFSSVLPLITLSVNFITVFFLKKDLGWSNLSFSRKRAVFFISLGILCFILCIIESLYAFPLVWFILFFILDPINALQNKRSILSEALRKNYTPLLCIAAASIFAGISWETLNHFIPKWTYPIEPWFWKLPSFFTYKYFEMPISGFFGYIPFSYSAFAFAEFIGLNFM